MDDSSLATFIDTVCGESRLRVEADLGDGFVRLRSSEAERRQAAQDIRSSEDIVIELLRNARDAGARHIFLATQKKGSARTLTIIDDGCGIPASQHERIFEPRVTSKLDTAHMDKWGMHGRGMALYSIAVNAHVARVQNSSQGNGASIFVETDTNQLGEKTDQSTFPHFEAGEGGVFAMRGPKNIVRTVAEFALEHRRDCQVFLGSPTDIAAALVAFGMAALSPAARAFCPDPEQLPLVKRLAVASDPDQLSVLCASLGLELSSRSARRIIDGSIPAAQPLVERLRAESFPAAPSNRKARKAPRGDQRGLRLADEDIDLIKDQVRAVMADIAERYYLEGTGDPEVSAGAEAIRITIPLEKMR